MDPRRGCPLPDFEQAAKLTQEDFGQVLSQIHSRTYHLEIPPRFDRDKVTLFFVGCIEPIPTVAALMNQVAGARGEPILRVLCGDNIYNSGASHPVKDEGFKRYFYNTHYDPKLENINGVPTWVVLGNHDGGFHKPTEIKQKAEKSSILGVPTLSYYVLGPSKVGWVIEQNEVLHSYLPTAELTMSEQLKKFQQAVLLRDQLSAWNMPSSSNSLIIGMNELFFLNTNHFFAEFIKYYNKKTNNEGASLDNNEVAWLIKTYENANVAGRTPILVTHHPAMTTLGKHLFSFDTEQYISKPEIAELNTILGIDPPTHSFTELLSKGLDFIGCKFDFRINAHDHFTNYIFDPKCGSQLTVGGGGGKLQNIYKLNHPYSGCQLEQFGFAAVSFPLRSVKKSERVIDIDIYTVDGLHLKFNSLSHEPIREGGLLNFEMLRTNVLCAAEFYYDTIPVPSKKLSNKPSSQGMFGKSMKILNKSVSAAGQLLEHMTGRHQREAGIVEDIVGYFNQYPKIRYDEARNFLTSKMIQLQQFGEAGSSFLSFLRQEAPELFPGEEVKEKPVCPYTALT